MIILKVKDAESDDDDLELPEGMNVNVPDFDSSGSEASTYITSESPTISSEEENSSIASAENDVRDPDEVQNADDPYNAVFPLSNDMDTSDHEESMVGHAFLFSYLRFGSFLFPPVTNRFIDSEAEDSDMELTSGIDEKSIIAGDPLMKICDPSITEKSDATNTDETTVEKTTPSDP